MPSRSTNKSKEPRRFQSEAEEADWLASPEARRAASRRFQKAIRDGNIIVNESRTLSPKLKEEAKRTGAVIVNKNGLEIKRTDPAVLEKLMAEARASMTQAVSLRIPLADLDAAKAIAAEQGIGYQTVLKKAIRDGLRRAS
jgi:predicted DNA binding CopG/RHH family protein